MMLPDQTTAGLRAQFPVFRHKIYLNSCSQGALSDAVREGFQELLATWDEGGSPWDIWIEQYEAARRAFAGMIGAEAEEIAVVSSVSAGINSIASSLDFGTRDTVVMGEFEFPTMGHIWLAQQRRGAKVEFLAAKGERLPADSYARAINRKTLIVPVTGVCFMNGFRSQVQEIVQAAHANGALSMLDDYQDCGTRPIDVKALGVDFYTAGTLKYLLGPPGVAFLYVRKELIDSLIPTVSGWFAQANPFAFDTTHFNPAPSARRFEAGTPPIPSLYGCLPGIGLLREIGLAAVASHVKKLACALTKGAQALGFGVKTPPDTVGPLVVLQCRDADGLVAKLAARDIIVSSRRDGLRVSFHVYNTLEDVDVLLHELQAHSDLLRTVHASVVSTNSLAST
jgi:selenocysteine lyase/cysteine desulfurase